MTISKEAKAAYDREYRAKNKARIAAVKRAYVLANPEKEQARAAAWIEVNKSRSLEIKRAWKARNPDAENTPEARERRAAYMRQYRKLRPETHRRAMSLRRAKVSHATPVWANKQAIKSLYAKAREAGLHVDHNIPLAGKTVCGLHVEGNLQLLPPRANRIKGNQHAG
jgi:hypothetical protein